MKLNQKSVNKKSLKIDETLPKMC